MLRNKGRVKIAIIIPLTLVILLPALFYGYSTTFAAKPPAVPVLLDPLTIPKYVNQLVVPPVYVPDAGTPATYTVKMVTSRQQILPTGTVLPGGQAWDGETNVWGYQGNVVTRGSTLGTPNTPISNFVFSPSATFNATKGTPITVNWVNDIKVPQPFAVDPTLYWANPNHAFPEGDIFSATGGPFSPFPPGYDGTWSATNPLSLNAQSPVALVPHLHGAEVHSTSDGGPEAWWTSGATNLRGPKYSTGGTMGATPATLGTAVYNYPNAQEPNTLWYHDHALGITRLNVMSGLAGFYLLSNNFDWNTPAPTPVTTTNLDEYLAKTFQYGISEIPIAIQDRTFKTNGELWFPEVGLNTKVHPYWMPEFFGDTIMVNGRVWPNLDVTPGWYRLRLLDGSNARFYTLSFSNAGVAIPFTVIGADGGYLQSKTTVTQMTIAPGERADVLIQFPPVSAGTSYTVTLTNTANAPFPLGLPADPLTTGQIMQFTVKSAGAVTQGVASIANLPDLLNPTLDPAGTFPTLPTTTIKRFITLNEVMGPKGPVMVVINGQYYNGDATENATLGTTEEWTIVNLTADTHPIHLHLVTFQLVSRQPFTATGVAKYENDWLKLQRDPILKKNYVPPFPRTWIPNTLDPAPYLQPGVVFPVPATEMGWKDTLQMNPGEVTTIRIKFASQDGSVFPFAFSETDPGYVWHCHIIDHEDNEMMRPLIVK